MFPHIAFYSVLTGIEQCSIWMIPNNSETHQKINGLISAKGSNKTHNNTTRKTFSKTACYKGQTAREAINLHDNN